MTDIVSLIPTVATQLADFSVGFVKLSVHAGQERADPAGSGALVTMGSVRGILTAAHVLEELPNDGKVRIIRFTRDRAIQKLTIDMSLTDKLSIVAKGEAAEGPDLGFLRLASDQAAALNATNVFFNLSKRQDSVLEDRHPSMEYFEGISANYGDSA